MFGIEDKVALVTGAFGGIGLGCVKALLNNNMKAITLIDIQNDSKTLDELKETYKNSNLIYFKADVSKKQELEAAFEETVKAFNQLDIVINNAGIIDEYNFEKVVGINFNGVLTGTMLALENYLQKFKSGKEAIIVNTSSIAGLTPAHYVPIYSITKQAITAIGRTLGTKQNYERTGVKILTVCPGITFSGLMTSRLVPQHYFKQYVPNNFKPQTSDFVGKEMVEVIKKGSSGSVWLVNDCKPAIELEINTFAKNCDCV